jgi:hypothetical protein
MTDAGPSRSFGPPQPGVLVTEELPEVEAGHNLYFDNYVKAYHGEAEFEVQIPQVRRALAVMEAARLSAKSGNNITFE